MYFLQTNKKKFLSNLSPLIVLGFVFFLILFRTTSVAYFYTGMHEWDILLPFAVYFGQRRQLMEGLTLTIVVSHLYSLSSTAPIGVFTLNYLFIFLISRALTGFIYANRSNTIVALLFCFTLISQVSLVLIAKAFGHTWNLFSASIFMSLLLNTLGGYLIYMCLLGVDRLTEKRPLKQIKIG